MDALVIAAAAGGDEAVAPGTEGDGFHGGSVDPAVLLRAKSDFFDAAAADDGVHSSHAVCLDEDFFCCLSVFSGAVKNSAGLEEATEIVISSSRKH